MKLIIGGAYQGKREYAKNKYHLTDDVIADGKKVSWDISGDIRCIDNYHSLIKRLTEAGEDTAEFTRRIIAEHPDIIIISTEIGSGIVPMERSDRRWRENTGRSCCLIAAASDTVVRITCGMETIIKGK
ncbi:MAG: bifunctional adenosylcobinamide kinase/adenosylcobinamide-phosphate guanylyltransferase [Huintestinicola sp.]